MPTCTKCGEKVGVLDYDLSERVCLSCRDRQASEGREAAAEAKYPKAWRAADKEQFENSPLYRELRRQTELLGTIKTILLWVMVIIPLASFALMVLFELLRGH